MSKNDFVAQAEKKVFRASFQDGLIDIGLSGLTLMFSVAPLLSESMGDFWSSAAFLPFWAALYLLLRWVRKRFVLPRTGTVSFGAERVSRLRRGGVVMLVLNVIILLGGLVSFFNFDGNGYRIALGFSSSVLVFFSIAGYLYDLPQLFVYGLLMALGIPVGEWLWQTGYASHHGYPVVFGTITGLIFLRGMIMFAQLMRQPVPDFGDQVNAGGV
jgi:hypothetical protein